MSHTNTPGNKSELYIYITVTTLLISDNIGQAFDMFGQTLVLHLPND